MDTTFRDATDDGSPPPPLDPVIVEILEEAAALPRLDPQTTPLDRQRRAVELAAAAWNDPPHPCARVETLAVPTPWGAMRARLFVPTGAREDEAVLYAHGGGWTFGSVDTHDGLTRRLASACRRPVLSIDYRLAPEHPFPAPVEDVAAGFAFLEAGGIGRPIAASRITVGGDSAGAQAVLALLLARRDARLTAAAAGLIFYGCLALDFDTASHRAFGRDETFLLSTERMRWYWANHTGARADDPGSAAPLRADLHDLPPLFLDAASHDCLRDDTLRLAAKLAAIGAPHRLRMTPGVVQATCASPGACRRRRRRSRRRGRSSTRSWRADGAMTAPRRAAVAGTRARCIVGTDGYARLHRPSRWCESPSVLRNSE